MEGGENSSADGWASQLFGFSWKTVLSCCLVVAVKFSHTLAEIFSNPAGGFGWFIALLLGELHLWVPTQPSDMTSQCRKRFQHQISQLRKQEPRDANDAMARVVFPVEDVRQVRITFILSCKGRFHSSASSVDTHRHHVQQDHINFRRLKCLCHCIRFLLSWGF